MDQLCLLGEARALLPDRVWLKFQVRKRGTGLSLDIGTGLQIFLRRFTEILAHLEGCAPRPAEGQVTQLPGKGCQGLEFQCYGFEFIDP